MRTTTLGRVLISTSLKKGRSSGGGSGGGTSGNSGIATGDLLTITPRTRSLTANGQRTFTASGGVPPYSYSVSDGAGSVSSAGVFTAPSFATTARVMATDRKRVNPFSLDSCLRYLS